MQVPGTIAGAIGPVVFLVVRSDQPRQGIHGTGRYTDTEDCGHLRSTRRQLEKWNATPVCANHESERDSPFVVISRERPFHP